MKTMTVFEARNNFSRTIEAAKDDVVVVTRNGRPVAAIQAIGDDDLEDILLERSERFWHMIARAWRGKAVSLERVATTLGVRRRAQARKQPQRPGGAAVPCDEKGTSPQLAPADRPAVRRGRRTDHAARIALTVGVGHRYRARRNEWT